MKKIRLVLFKEEQQQQQQKTCLLYIYLFSFSQVSNRWHIIQCSIHKARMLFKGNSKSMANVNKIPSHDNTQYVKKIHFKVCLLK